MNVRTAIKKGIRTIRWGHETLPSLSMTEILSLFPVPTQKKGWASGLRSARSRLPAGTIPKGLKDMPWGELLATARTLASQSANPALSSNNVRWMFATAALMGGVAVMKYRPDRERLCRLCPRHAHPSLKYCRSHTRKALNSHRHAKRVHTRMSQEWKDRHKTLDGLVRGLAKARDPKTLDIHPEAPPPDWHQALVKAGTAATVEHIAEDMGTTDYTTFIDRLRQRFPDQDVYENYHFMMWKAKTALLAEQNKVDSWKLNAKTKLTTSDLPTRIRELAREGRTRAEIARICGVTRAAITQAIKRNRNNLEGAIQKIKIGDDGGDDFWL